MTAHNESVISSSDPKKTRFLCQATVQAEWTASAMPGPAPLRCRNCGSNKFIVPDHATNDRLVRCAHSGETIGTWGEVRIGLLEEAEEEKAARRLKAHKAT